jgi:glycosyltransferase involved in cell wall biosynthesis
VVKRGLIVSYYFPPVGGGGVQRWSKFIKYLSLQDWQFNVVTRPHSPNEILDGTLLKDVPDSVNIIEVSDPISNQHYKFLKSNYMKRWLSSLFFITDSRKNWVNKAWQKVDEELSSSNYDLVICSIPPYSVSNLALKSKNKFSKTPVVLDMRDPWNINPYKIYPTPIHKYFDKRKELKTISKLDNLISAYQSTLNYYFKNIVDFDKKKKIVISNGYDEDDFQNLKSKKLQNPDSFNIAFSGTFYSHLNNPDLFFQALAVLKREGQQIYFHHIGTSVYNVQALANKYGIGDSLVNWGYKNHQECLEILNSMNAFVVILDSKYKNASTTVGGKVYEYLRFKKPILGLVPTEGEAAQLILNSKAGIVCGSSDAGDIAESIKKLKSNKFEYSAIEQFSRKNLAIQLNDYLQKII